MGHILLYGKKMGGMMREGQRDQSAMRQPKSDARLLVDRLMDLDLISDNQLHQIEMMQVTTGESYIHVLTRLGLVSSDSVANVQASILELPKASEKHLALERCLFDNIEIDFIRKRAVIPFVNDDEEISLAMVDATDSEALSMVSLVFDRSIRQYVISADLFHDCLTIYETDQTKNGGESVPKLTLSDDDVVRLEDLARESPVVSFVDGLIKRAADAGASDIHIDPLRVGFDVRFRIDGVLQAQTMGTSNTVEIVVSRIKILAKLNIAERRLPQDGRFRQTINGRTVDFRVATIPGIFGEATVLRLLYQDDAQLTLDELGFHAQACDRLHQGLSSPHGMVLVTGPTGSGKSTTLYAALRSMMSDDRKFISVEDPVEYQISGVTQIQVKPEIGLNFARTLRSVLRHDPNVLMVGEIRDGETAQIAFQAALTGHTVISTLHTNNAASTLTRLIEMGVEDYLVTSCVRTIVAQRLVRKLCPNCKQPAAANEAFLTWSGHSQSGDKTVFEPKGCVSCAGTGYQGRFAIGEVLTLTPEIRKLIMEGTDELTVHNRAKQSGMVSLREACAMAVLDGQTSLEEAMAVTGGGT